MSDSILETKGQPPAAEQAETRIDLSVRFGAGTGDDRKKAFLESLLQMLASHAQASGVSVALVAPASNESPSRGDLERSVLALQKTLTERTKERDDAKAGHLRALADFDNYQKRERRERERFREDATRELLKEIIPAVDDIDLATEAALGEARAKRASGDEAFATAFEGVAKGFSVSKTRILSLLARRGVEPLGTKLGDHFDPVRHEAISVEPCPGLAKDDVVSVAREGYKLGSTTLRPAMVHVRKAVPASSQPNS